MVATAWRRHTPPARALHRRLVCAVVVHAALRDELHVLGRVLRARTLRAARKLSSPPGKYALAVGFALTSHGSRRSEMLITWSRLAPSPYGAQKAIIEPYSPSLSFWNERRASIPAFTSSGSAMALKPEESAPKKRVLPPAT
eukprot:6262831-Prymnesium_polylepis.2